MTAQAQQRIFPAFAFDRAEPASIPEDAFWELQTYFGLGEDLCANEGARSFITESTRKQTPLGRVHRYHIRQQLSIDAIREMYHEAMQRLLAETTSRSEYFGESAVAIDTIEADPSQAIGKTTRFDLKPRGMNALAGYATFPSVVDVSCAVALQR